MSDIKAEWLDQLSKIRNELDHGDKATQEQLDTIAEEWKDRRHRLRKREKDEEFELVNSGGTPRDLHAPRWLCHLLGLRHKCAHVMVRWTTPGLGRLLVLQVRSWSKSDAPGHVDISVGGHVVGKTESEQIAYSEMEEELGITPHDLVGGKLLRRDGYHNKPDERPSENFYNVEWRDIYLADLIPSRIDNLRFSDEEVVGLYLCPELEARNLFGQKQVPIASALRQYLEKFALPSSNEA